MKKGLSDANFIPNWETEKFLEVTKEQLTDEQRKRMTDFVFSNEDILSQLREASIDPEYIEDDEEAYRILREAKDGR